MGESTSAGRTVDHALNVSLPQPITQALSSVSSLSGIISGTQSVFGGYAKKTAYSASTTRSSTRTVRPASDPGEVRFLHDVEVGLEVRRTGQDDPQRARTVLERALVGTYPRGAVRALPRPAGTDHATSALRTELSGEPRTSTAHLFQAAVPDGTDTVFRTSGPATVGPAVAFPALSWVDSVTGAEAYRAAVFAAAALPRPIRSRPPSRR